MPRKQSFVRQTRMWYVLGLIVSLGIIFIYQGGLGGIKLGMDLAGGVRLTYLIDYSKYESLYDNPNELIAAKKTARDIITVQLDNRISQLGVSNYEARSQLIDGKEYMVIELGGVPDVQAAKEVIGKTVELEFGLENTTTGSGALAERQELVNSLSTQATQNTIPLEQLGTTNGSKGVTYYALSGTRSELPTYYQSNDLIDTLSPGELSPAAEGVFQDYPADLEQYGLVDQEGYIITRLIDREEVARQTYDQGAFLTAVPDAQLEVVSEPTQTQTGAAYYADGRLIYPVGEVLPQQSGLNLRIYSYEGQDPQTAIADINASDATQTYQGRLATDQASIAIPGYTYTPGQEWTTVQAGSGYTLVHVTDTKNADQTRFEQYVLPMDESSADEVLSSLTTPVVYTLETLLVDRTQPRKPATDPSNGDVLNGGHFEYAAVGSTQFGEPTVDITFNDKGAQIFCNITAANIQKPLAIFVGGEIKTNAIIQDKICGGTTQISGNYTREEAQKLVKDLNEGALPAPLMLVQEEQVVPALGQQALQHILWAGLIGIAAIAIYMAIVYGPRWSLIALAILAAFIIFMLALLKLLGAVLGLSGLAAIILSIGMSVDATILVYERIIENHKKGQSLRDSIIDAHKQARSAVRDGNLSTGMIALLLVFMGVNIFKGFGTMMVLNICVVLVLIYPLVRILALHFIRKTK